MLLEIVTPEQTLFKGEVESVAVPGKQGEFQMLNNHAAIVSLLKKGFVKVSGNIELNEETERHFEKKDNRYWLPINSGTLEMNKNKAIILVDWETVILKEDWSYLSSAPR